MEDVCRALVLSLVEEAASRCQYRDMARSILRVSPSPYTRGGAFRGPTPLPWWVPAPSSSSVAKKKQPHLSHPVVPYDVGRTQRMCHRAMPSSAMGKRPVPRAFPLTPLSPSPGPVYYPSVSFTRFVTSPSYKIRASRSEVQVKDITPAPGYTQPSFPTHRAVCHVKMLPPQGNPSPSQRPSPSSADYCQRPTTKCRGVLPFSNERPDSFYERPTTRGWTVGMKALARVQGHEVPSDGAILEKWVKQASTAAECGPTSIVTSSTTPAKTLQGRRTPLCLENLILDPSLPSRSPVTRAITIPAAGVGLRL